jgi:hypothetical protein
MRWLLVAPGDFIRLVGVVAAMIGVGAAGERIARWVRERGLPSAPIARHLITCPRCSGDGPICPQVGRGSWRYACPELARLGRSVLIRGIAADMARGFRGETDVESPQNP